MNYQQQQYNMQYQQYNQFQQQMMPRLQGSQSQDVLMQTPVRPINENIQGAKQPQMQSPRNYMPNPPQPNVGEKPNDEIKITQEVMVEEQVKIEPEVTGHKSEKNENEQKASPVPEHVTSDNEQNKHDEKPIITIQDKEEIKHKHNSSFNAEDIPIKTNKLSFEELLAQNLKNEGGNEDDVFRRASKPVQSNQKSKTETDEKDKKTKVVEHSPQRSSEDKGSYLISKFV